MTNPNDPAFPETWTSVPGFVNVYEVSNLGNVRSWYMGGSRRKVPKNKTLQLGKNGYYQVVLSYMGFVKAWNVHRLVLTAFRGEKPSFYDASHVNGNRLDNRLSNLRWATRKENEADKIIHGTKAIGEKNGQSKLKREHVDEIWMALYKGLPERLIAKQYGVCQQTISAIASGKTWRDIQCLTQK